MAVFPLREDRIGIAVVIAAAYLIAFVGNDFLLQAVMIPFLVFALAAIGLNILTGYAGPALARHRRLHGRRRLCLLQADDRLSGA